MPEVGVGYVPIKPDLNGFGRDLDRNMGPEINRAGPGISSKFSGIFKSVAALGGGILAGAAIGGFLKGAVAEAQEAAKIGRLTEAVVKSTGGAANVSADQLGKLSERLSNIAAVDDEVIQGAGNVLLTFTKVRNEVGEGNNIFDRTTEAALNMSAALGTDLQGSTMQLGKALNDPIKGLTALGRAGVSFTEQQKEQVKAMVAAGDTLGAQKLILAEMETQFGGAAAAAADPMARLGVIVGNLQEKVGGALLPIIEKASIWIGENLPTALDFAGRAFGKVSDFVKPIVDLIGGVIDVFAGGGDHGAGLIVELGNFFGLAEDDSRLEPFFSAMERIENVMGVVVDFVRDNLKPILIGLGIAVAAAAAPLVTLAAGLVYAYTQFDGFRSVVDAVVSFITGTVVPAVTAFASAFTEQLGNAVAWVQTMWPQVSEAIGHVMVAVQTVVETVLAVVQKAWELAGDDILRIAEAAWGFIQDTVKNAMDFIQGIIQTVLALINGDWGKAWDGIKQALSAVWDQIKNVVTTAIDLVKSNLGAAMSVIGEAWGVAWEGIKTVASGAFDAVVGFVGSLPQRAKDALEAAWSVYWEFWSRLFTEVAGFVSARIDDVVSWFGGLPGRIVAAVELYIETLRSLGDRVVRWIWQGIRTVVTGAGGLIEWFGGIPGWIAEKLEAGVERLIGLGKAIVERIIEGIKSVAGGIGSAILDAIPGGGVIGNAIGAITGGDGPGRGRGGTAMATVQRAMQGIPGLYVTSTYRTPAENARVGGSPTSYHLDRNNPAVDVGGRMSSLDALYRKLSPIGGRELLWRTDGHYDHLHYAHDGGHVTPTGVTPLRTGEVPIIAQVGETILPRGSGSSMPDMAYWERAGRTQARAYAAELRLQARSA